MDSPLVAVIMGSKSDWETMKHADEMLTRFGVPHERQVVSAHRTPAWMAEFATGAAARGLEVIVAGAGGAAHLPGMVAAHTVLPVIGVPVISAHGAALGGMDALHVHRPDAERCAGRDGRDWCVRRRKRRAARRGDSGDLAP